jgi:hypothetical protein
MEEDGGRMPYEGLRIKEEGVIRKEQGGLTGVSLYRVASAGRSYYSSRRGVDVQLQRFDGRPPRCRLHFLAGGSFRLMTYDKGADTETLKAGA